MPSLLTLSRTILASASIPVVAIWCCIVFLDQIPLIVFGLIVISFIVFVISLIALIMEVEAQAYKDKS